MEVHVCSKMKMQFVVPFRNLMCSGSNREFLKFDKWRCTCVVK